MVRRLTLLVVLVGSVLIFSPDRAWCQSADGRQVRVAVYDDAGISRGIDNLMAVLGHYPDLRVQRLKAEDIRAGRLANFDVLIQPGGSGSKEGETLGEEGRKQIRAFVHDGKGYVGICAGAYLATCDYSWSLHILNAKVVDRKHWARGYGPVDITLTRHGKEILGGEAEKRSIYYHQGPLLAPANDPEVPAYEGLATFAGEIAKNGAPSGVMQGTTAIALGHFGDGRVLCFSPHPEKTEGLQDMVYRGILWAVGR